MNKNSDNKKHQVERLVSSISSPRYGYHCTTKKKLQRYHASKRIIAPVRFWPNRLTAERWARRTGRELILRVRLDHISYPLPDHKPAMFCPKDVVCFDCYRPSITSEQITEFNIK